MNCPRFQLPTDEHGTIDIELQKGCGHNPKGVAVLVNGVCAVHFSGMLHAFAKMDVYATAARIAGMNWVDIFAGETDKETCVGSF